MDTNLAYTVSFVLETGPHATPYENFLTHISDAAKLPRREHGILAANIYSD
jgi:hypothetical protein